jgi:cation diffusion facilitator family transporter
MSARRPDRSALYRDAVRASLLGLFVNATLGVVKLVGGIVGHSSALVTDAANSIGDVVTSLAVLFALRVAQRPADEEHPYGHTRAEAIAGSNVALLVLVSALWLGWAAFRTMWVVHPLPPGWTLAIAASNIVIKEALYRYKIRIGRRLGSSAVIAHAWDHRSDALCALAVLIGLGLVRAGGPRWIFADELAALAVAAMIAVTAVRLLHASVNELMDVQADDSLVHAVRAAALAVPGVRGVETLWIRKSGLEYLMDVHIEVDGGLTIAEGHRLGHVVKDVLLERFPALRDVLVHLEPYPHDDAPDPVGRGEASR